ncbi:MAG TPA: alpha/beta hydrolase [Sphingomicrobium sp.]|nr:alpha/beta hydrolase [Sphingomicrobium sp.]
MTSLTGALLLMSGAAAAAVPGDSLYARPGRFFTASDGTKLNFYCMGKGSPTVVFESGEGDWSPSWATVQPAVSQWTRACSYDRSGSGFSSLGPLPTSARRFADELHSALRNGGVRGPYILVGHASGGDIVRIFADRYLSDVAGMVLIDPAERDVETNHDLDDLWQGIDERNRGHLAFCRDSVAAHKPFPLTPPPDHPGWTCLSYSYRGVPDPRFSRELNDSMVHTMSTRVEMWQALLSGVGERAEDKEYLQAHRRSLGSRPLRVILAAYEIPPTSRLPAEQRIRFNDGFRKGGMNLLTLSTNAKLITTDTGAFVQWEKPDIVIDAIREVYDQASGRRK